MFPVHIMHDDSVWLNRLSYDTAERECHLPCNVRNSICEENNDIYDVAACSVEHLNENPVLPLAMMEDSARLNRLEYEQVDDQLSTGGCVENVSPKLDLQTQTEALLQSPEVEHMESSSRQASVSKKNMFPIEMMSDSVWMNRQDYVVAEENCQIILHQSCETKRDNITKKVSQEKGGKKPVCTSNGQRASSKDSTEHSEELIVESSSLPHLMLTDAADLTKETDLNVFKGAVIHLTKFVQSLSQENVKLKNRLTNSEARVVNIAKSVKNAVAKSHSSEPKNLKNRVEKLEGRVQKVEKHVNNSNLPNYNASHLQQVNAMQLDQMKQQLLLVCHHSNQNTCEMIKKLESSQKIDKLHFERAMENMQNYLQNRSFGYNDELKKLKFALENFVSKKTQGVDDIVKKIKKQQEIDKENKSILECRIKKLEGALEEEKKNVTKAVLAARKSENLSWAERSAITTNPSLSYYTKIAREKPVCTRVSSDSSGASSLDADCHTSNSALNRNAFQASGEENVIGYLGKANDYLEHFQKKNCVRTSGSGAKTSAPGGKATEKDNAAGKYNERNNPFITGTSGGSGKSAPVVTKPLASWTKSAECKPMMVSPGVKSTANSTKATLQLQGSQEQIFGMGEYSDDPLMSGVKINDPVVVNWLKWKLPRRKETATEIIHHSIAFLTGLPGYRLQMRAQIDRLHGDIYFAVRLLKGPFDDALAWPFNEKFLIRMASKMKTGGSEPWIIPKEGLWTANMSRPVKKKDNICSEWVGPFNISNFLEKKRIELEFMTISI